MFRPRPAMLLLYFYPRSPCGERPGHKVVIFLLVPISIHALLAESDSRAMKLTLSSRISIHALLAESDPSRPLASSEVLPFLSTLSLRRATQQAQGVRLKFSISIHALLAESDGMLCRWPGRYCNFYPRSPCGERRVSRPIPSGIGRISIHALLAESDSKLSATSKFTAISIHALLAESDLLVPHRKRRSRYFYPRSPCGERHFLGPQRCAAFPDFYPRSPCGERRRMWTACSV